MPNIAWNNDNQFRDYPFMLRVEPLAETSGFSSLSSESGLLHLPQNAILDFGAIMGIDAGFDDELGHMVYLHSISRFADVFTFRFRTDATDAENYELTFSRSLTALEYEITYEEASTIDPEDVADWVCPDNPRWHGFIVTGVMTDLANIVANGETVYADDGLWQIEPARIQNLAKSYLRSVNLANVSRVMSTVPANCDEDDAATSTIIMNASCMTGNLRFKEGYNCTIRQDNNNNAIIISAGVGLGEGLPCEEIPLYEDEVPPVDSQFLSGGPGCNDVIKSINGVTGTNISLIPGAGFRVEAHATEQNTLVVDRSLEDFAYCRGSDTNSSISTGD